MSQQRPENAVIQAMDIGHDDDWTMQCRMSSVQCPPSHGVELYLCLHDYIMSTVSCPSLCLLNSERAGNKNKNQRRKKTLVSSWLVV